MSKNKLDIVRLSSNEFRLYAILLAVYHGGQIFYLIYESSRKNIWFINNIAVIYEVNLDLFLNKSWKLKHSNQTVL
jgi:hypothetical protein